MESDSSLGEQPRLALPPHDCTPTYLRALGLLTARKADEALTAFSAEEASSSCYGLARSQAAQIKLFAGDNEGAIAEAQIALKDFDEKGCPWPPLGVATRRTIGDALDQAGGPLQASGHYLGALELADELKRMHPEGSALLESEKAFVLVRLAGVCNRLDQFESARDYATRAGDVLRNQRGKIEIWTAEGLENLAIAYQQLGKVDAATYAIEEALGLELSAEQRLKLAGC